MVNNKKVQEHGNQIKTKNSINGHVFPILKKMEQTGYVTISESDLPKVEEKYSLNTCLKVTKNYFNVHDRLINSSIYWKSIIYLAL